MPAGGILPPPNVSADPTGRPRRRKVQRGWAPPNPRKFRLRSAGRRKKRPLVNRAKRRDPKRKQSRVTQKQHPRNPKLNPWPSGAPPHPTEVPGTGAVAVDTILIVLPAGQTIPLGSVNRDRLDPRGVTRHRHPPRKNPRLLRNVLRAHRLRNRQKSPRRAFAGGMAIPAWLHALRN